MVPTVLGAWIGVTTGIMRDDGAGMSAIVFLAARSASSSRSRRRRTRPPACRAARLHVLHGPDAVAPDRRGARLQNGAGLIMMAFAAPA
jgi:hypothetical protein